MVMYILSGSKELNKELKNYTLYKIATWNRGPKPPLKTDARRLEMMMFDEIKILNFTDSGWVSKVYINV